MKVHGNAATIEANPSDGNMKRDFIVTPGDYNIAWDSPSEDANGSMPIGNGDIGANVWIEPNGDICFYISKTDTWDDNGRLVKVGKVRVTCDPPLVAPGSGFKQVLDLQRGCITVEAGRGTIRSQVSVWIDAHHPALTVSHNSTAPMSMTASVELWRTEPYLCPQVVCSDLLEDRTKPDGSHEPMVIEPDTIVRGLEKCIGWYHHNKKSVGFDRINALQGLAECCKENPILHRTFGGLITGHAVERIDDTTLRTAGAEVGHITIHVLTLQPSTPTEWLEQVQHLAARTEASSVAERQAAHEDWWKAFWERSWIHVRQNHENPASDDAFVVAQSYALQRFIDACAGRGRHPIKFNGSIFTVPHKGDPDYRQWGPGYWWQNTRLPYISKCAAGDFDLMLPFFQMYGEDVFKVNVFRTRKYLGHGGAFYPECVYFWGSTFASVYGETPFEAREDKLQESGWHKWEWIVVLIFVKSPWATGSL